MILQANIIKVMKELNILTREQIKEQAPSVFTDRPVSTVSEHYMHIPTDVLIDDMKILGFEVVDAKEVKARKNIGFQKHLLKFRNPNIYIEGKDGDDSFVEILIQNSHDASSSFKFNVGIFRLVCENGLVISEKEFGSFRIDHIGYEFQTLQNTIKEMVEKASLTVDSMNRMKQVELSEEKLAEFAKRALQLRLNKEEVEIEDFEEFTKPTRPEDEDMDLYTKTNLIQEKLMHGMFKYRTDKGKVRKARKIKNFKQDVKFNQDLFDLALSYIY